MESSCSAAPARRRLRGRDQGDVSRVGGAAGAVVSTGAALVCRPRSLDHLHCGAAQRSAYRSHHHDRQCGTSLRCGRGGGDHSSGVSRCASLCWLLGPSVLETRDKIRKQPGALQISWPIVSACHAGRLADHPTPVGSVKWLSAPFLAGFVRRSRIPTIGSAHHPTTEAPPPGCVALPPVQITSDTHSSMWCRWRSQILSQSIFLVGSCREHCSGCF
jgi:hypothetical protein